MNTFPSRVFLVTVHVTSDVKPGQADCPEAHLQIVSTAATAAAAVAAAAASDAAATATAASIAAAGAAAASADVGYRVVVVVSLGEACREIGAVFTPRGGGNHNVRGISLAKEIALEKSRS